MVRKTIREKKKRNCIAICSKESSQSKEGAGGRTGISANALGPEEKLKPERKENSQELSGGL